MAISKGEVAIVVVGLSVAVLMGYFATASVDVQTYPDVELSVGGGLDKPVGMQNHEFVTPGNSLVPVVYTPHRYPNVSGSNITALVHHGFTPLRKRAPSDSKWIECPPAEVMF